MAFHTCVVLALAIIAVGKGRDDIKQADDEDQGSLSRNNIQKQLSDFKTAPRRTSSVLVADSVCFGAASDTYGTFTLVDATDQLTLEHKSGYVSCCDTGCDYCLLDNWGSNRGRINVWITRDKQHQVAPYPDNTPEVKESFKGHYFYYPGEGSSCASSIDSSTVTFQDFFPAGEYQVWYGQDLRDQYEHDNDGNSCVSVLAGGTSSCSHVLTVASTLPMALGGLEYFRTRDATFSVLTTIPEDKVGCLFEAGGQGRGTFLGLVSRSSSYYLRFTAGDGGSVGDSSDSDTAVIMVKLPDPRIPTDGNLHNLTWTISVSSHGIQLYIDGELFQARSSSEFPCNQWAGGDAAGFGQGYEGIADGGIMTLWPGTIQGNLKAHGPSRIQPFTDECASEYGEDSPLGCCETEADCFAQPGCPGSAGVHCDSDDGSFKCERADWDPICNGKKDGHQLGDGSWCYNEGRRYRHCPRPGGGKCPGADEDDVRMIFVAIAVGILAIATISTICGIFLCWRCKVCCWQQPFAQSAPTAGYAYPNQAYPNQPVVAVGVVVGQPMTNEGQPSSAEAVKS